MTAALLRGIARESARALEKLRFGAPVACVYNPLVYAREPHERYLQRYGGGTKEAVFIGMNPGPWGMAQTGVPFGEVRLVRDWLGIEGEVRQPDGCHPKRPVTGFDCHRSEVSGTRFWGWAKKRFGTPQEFFERFFVANYCPLLFFSESGRNITPDKLAAGDREALYAVCDRALAETVRILKPRAALGIGKFAAGRAREALGQAIPLVVCLTHPSPANPAANRGWEACIERELREADIA